MKSIILYFSFLIFLSLGCTTQPKNDNQLDTKAPKESYNQAKNTMDAQLPSTINVPFEISMSDIERQINSQVQGLIYEDNSFEDDNQDNIQSKVYKIAPITVTAVKDTFHFVVPLKIWVNYRFQILGLSQEKSTELQMKLKFATSFKMQPNWEVKTQTQADGYEWITKPILKLGPINLPIGNIVGKFMNSRQDKMYGALDDAISKNIEIKKYVLQAWNIAKQPYLLSPKYKTWLKITPQEILMTPLISAGNKVKSAIGFKVVTETIIGNKPLVTNDLDIPNLIIVNQISDDFKVAILAEISHQEAQKMLADTMIGQKFSFQNGKFNVEVTSIDLYGNDEKLIIKAGLKGSVNGDIYFKGIPFYSPSTKTILMKDFDYDLNTKNILMKSANWLIQGKLSKNLQQAFTFPIGGQIDENKKEIQNFLDKRLVAKGITLSGKIENIEPQQVILSPTSIKSVIYANGKMNLIVDGL